MQIKAFKALRFNSEQVGDVGDCATPPYDVIDQNQQEALYQKNPHNIVRIIKPKPNSSEPEEQKYAHVAELFKNWIGTQALKFDSDEAIYAYSQDFQIAGRDVQRNGFVALGKLTQFGSGVQPHEKTLDAPKADRLNLMTATAAQFGQIFMLYDDPEKTADNIILKAISNQPLVEFEDLDNVRHRLFAITDATDINAIINMMADKQAIIADGHHRYETALNYYNQTANSAAAYRMMTFVNMHNEGVVILPTHRLVSNLKDFRIENLLDSLAENFQITNYLFTDEDTKQDAKQKMFTKLTAEFQANRQAFGIYAGGNNFYSAVLQNPAAMDDIASQLSPASKKLDVSVLHKLILENILGIGEKQLAAQSNIEYIKDIGNAVDASIAEVDTSGKQLVFFMNPTKVEQVKDVAAQNEKMPQKSTFFYPKVYTGLTINKL